MEENYFELNLPSKLIPYKSEGVSKVEIRMLKGKDLKIIGEATTANFEKKFKLLLKNILRGIEPGRLTIGDRIYIVIWLTLNCHSNLFPIELMCEHCFRTDKDYKVDLGKLEKVLLPDDFQEPYSLKLPNGESVLLRLYRVDDQIQYMDYIEAKKEDDIIFKLAQVVVGDETIDKKVERLNGMSLQDIDLIRAFLEKYYHGVDMNASYTCKHCGGTGKTPVPFRIDLLFPAGALVAESLGYHI
jgi:hypothetical protein